MSENRKALIDQGAMATRNLADCLAVDQRVLAASVAAQVDGDLAKALQEAAESSHALGISKKIATIGLAFGQWLEATPAPSRDADLLFSHPSDTVRGWAAFANAWAEGLSVDRMRADRCLP